MFPADFTKQERIEGFLQRSLLGEELVNTQFHLFSTKSTSKKWVNGPRVLCANDALLVKSSAYFLDLLCSGGDPSDRSLIDIMDLDDIPENVKLDEYGHESDSDLDDEDWKPTMPVTDISVSQDETATGLVASPQTGRVTLPEGNNLLSDNSSDSDTVIIHSRQPAKCETIGVVDESASVTCDPVAIQETLDTKPLEPLRVMRPWVLGSRHILVKDTAFRTCYALLNYLYTGKIHFLPLTSSVSEGRSTATSINGFAAPKCSAKSMYRLACKIGLDDLRTKALAHIRKDLTENNILKELLCALTSRYSELLEMELDVLYAHMASPPVVEGFPALAGRIANKELPHGVQVIMGIHARILKARGPPPPFELLAPPASQTIGCKPSNSEQGLFGQPKTSLFGGEACLVATGTKPKVAEGPRSQGRRK